jgi:hypothetical protein
MLGESTARSRPAREEGVAEHLKAACLAFAGGTAEGVDRVADADAGEAGVLQHLLPARTGQPARYSTGPQVDVPQCLGRDGPAVGDVGELQPAARLQNPPDLCERCLLVRYSNEYLTRWRDHAGAQPRLSVAQRDLVRFGDLIRLNRSQPFTEALASLSQQNERVGGGTLGGAAIRISAMLLDEVSLNGCGDFVGRLQGVVDGQIPRGVVNHGANLTSPGSGAQVVQDR